MKALKLISLFLLSSAFLSSCALDTRDRSALGPTYSGGSNNNSSSNDTDTSSGSSGGNRPNIPSEISHCSWSQDGVSGFAKSSNHLGNYTLCQSKTNETNVYIQVATVPNVPVCVIPLYQSGGSSTYIGSERCLTITSNKTIYQVDLYKNRNGYSSYALNGVMVLKDRVYYTYGYPYLSSMMPVDAYFQCMYYAMYSNNNYCKAFNTLGEHIFHVF